MPTVVSKGVELTVKRRIQRRDVSDSEVIHAEVRNQSGSKHTCLVANISFSGLMLFFVVNPEEVPMGFTPGSTVEVTINMRAADITFDTVAVIRWIGRITGNSDYNVGMGIEFSHGIKMPAPFISLVMSTTEEI